MLTSETKKKEICDDTWNLLAEIPAALEVESISDIKDAASHLLNQI